MSERIILTSGGVAIDLPPDLVWTNEMSWAAVSQATERGITGALIVDVSQRVGGQPIALEGESNSAWIDRATLRFLKGLLSAPGQEMELDLRGEKFSVLFDHGDGEETKALSVTPVVRYADLKDGDYYCNLVLRFLTS